MVTELIQILRADHVTGQEFGIKFLFRKGVITPLTENVSGAI